VIITVVREAMKLNLKQLKIKVSNMSLRCKHKRRDSLGVIIDFKI